MARVTPELIDTRVQLVFAEGFGMDSNHFTPLWDRIGAWAPRRLGLDPWGDGVCRECCRLGPTDGSDEHDPQRWRGRLPPLRRRHLQAVSSSASPR